jgi:hypothetical protein
VIRPGLVLTPVELLCAAVGEEDLVQEPLASMTVRRPSDKKDNKDLVIDRKKTGVLMQDEGLPSK